MRVVLMKALALATLLGQGVSGQAVEWSRFRGADGLGIGSDRNIPLQWGESRNLKWKTPLAGPGNSSPVVSKGLIFLTAYSGYGISRENPGDIANLKRHVICIDAVTGKQLWMGSVSARQPEDPYRGYLTEHGYASNSAVADGERVYVFFGKTGALAFDFDGKELWRVHLGSESSNKHWGSAASPILYKDMVIVNASEESQSIVALNKTTGKIVWKTEASAMELTYGTPVLTRRKDGRDELVISVPYELWGLNPDTGKLRWFAETGIPGNVSPSALVHEGTIFAFGGYPRRKTVAVPTEGKGDITSSILWTSNRSPYVPTPVIHEGHLFWVNRDGMAFCMDAKSGRVVYQERLDSKGLAPKFYASPVLFSDRVYAVSRNRGTFVLQANPKFQQLAQNEFKLDDSEFAATPALVNGKMYLRSSKFLYCIESEK